MEKKRSRGIAILASWMLLSGAYPLFRFFVNNNVAVNDLKVTLSFVSCVFTIILAFGLLSFKSWAIIGTIL